MPTAGQAPGGCGAQGLPGEAQEPLVKPASLSNMVDSEPISGDVDGHRAPDKDYVMVLEFSYWGWT